MQTFPCILVFNIGMMRSFHSSLSLLFQIIGAAIVLVSIILTQKARANKVIDAGLAFRA
jgi:hypothetical protein